MTDPLWFGTSGPPDAKIVIVAESWGAEEEAAQRPLVGSSGVELNRMLAEAGLQRDSIFVTNVIAARPQSNETWRFFDPKSAPTGPAVRGLHPTAGTTSEIRRLYSQLGAHPRQLVIVCGNYALWALSNCSGTDAIRASNNRKLNADEVRLGPNGIMNWRGSMWYVKPAPEICEFDVAEKIEGIQLLPIIHPAAILRQWELRAVTVHDLKTRVPKALRNDWRPNPPPVVWAPPPFAQAVGRLNHWLNLADSGQIVRLAEDIETNSGFITCIGFADSPHFAMSIPFIRPNGDGSWDAWWTVEQEATLIRLLNRINRHPNVHIIGQNFIYDTQYIQNWYGVTPHCTHDTMLAQNVLFPGTPKDLGYLSSLYCDYHWYWKDDAKEWDGRGDFLSLLRYNSDDCLRTWEIAAAQAKVLKATKLEERFDFKMRVHGLCLRMMNRGIKIDTKRRSQQEYELMEILHQLESQLLEIIPQDWVKPIEKKTDKFWYRSAQQTAKLFYDLLGFTPVLHPKTKQPTVGKLALKQLKAQNPAFSGLFSRLDKYGSIDNTIGVLQSPLESDGKMRSSLNPGGTETHRLSSSTNAWGRGTNFQNLTKGDED